MDAQKAKVLKAAKTLGIKAAGLPPTPESVQTIMAYAFTKNPQPAILRRYAMNVDRWAVQVEQRRMPSLRFQQFSQGLLRLARAVDRGVEDPAVARRDLRYTLEEPLLQDLRQLQTRNSPADETPKMAAINESRLKAVQAGLAALLKTVFPYPLSGEVPDYQTKREKLTTLRQILVGTMSETNDARNYSVLQKAERIMRAAEGSKYGADWGELQDALAAVAAVRRSIRQAIKPL